MQDSYSELIKLLLPEFIMDYFELTSYKKAEATSFVCKRN
jgi:hypothetical protein